MPIDAKPRVRIYLLNDIRIETPNGRIDPNAEVVFGAALYILLERRSSVARRVLERILWPHADAAAASHRLRQTFLKLKKLGLPLINTSRTNIGLVDTEVTVDLLELLQGRSDLTDDDCVALGQVLQAYNPNFSKPFVEWFEVKRSEFVSAVTRFMLDRIATQRSEGRWSEIDVWAGSLRALSPYNEEATLALAESLAMRGSKIEAKQLLDDYLKDVGTLSTELRIEASLLRHRISSKGATSEEAQQRESRLFGRTDEIRPLIDMIRRVKSGTGESVLILGDAGIGKSRLLHELGGFAKLEGFTVHRIQCRSSHIYQPLAAFVELAPVLRRLRGAIGCLPETLADLDRLASHRPPTGSVPLDAGDSQWAYGRILRSLFDILDAVSDESPLLIQIEDAHWLDATSRGVLAEMTEWCGSHSVCFALTAREIPQSWNDDLATRLRSRRLKPLDEQSSRLLFTEIATRAPRQLDRSYVDWCVAAAEGNPYFLQELATHWVETGDKTALPPSLSAVLGNRVDRLSADELQVLQLCALLENNSTLPRIERILGYEPHRLLEAINGLGSTGMLTMDSPDVGVPSDRISSKHEILSQVALERLAKPARVYLHRKIAQALESEVESAFSAAVMWDCAKHWRLGGDAKRALTLALSCGQHLMDMGLSSEAIEAFERCLPYCISDSQRLDVLKAEVLVYYRGSDWKRVREITQLARAVKNRVAPSELHDDLELMDLRAQWQSLQWSEIATKALACLNAVEATPRHRVEGGTMALMLVGFQSDTESLPWIYEQVCQLIDQHNLPAALRHQADMVYHTEFGDARAAVAAARQLIETHRVQNNVAELFRAHCNAGVTFRVAGIFHEAEESLLDALRLAERYELSASIIRVLPMLGNLALERGEFDRAGEYHQRMLSLVIDSANEIAALEVGALGARLALIQNNGEKARQCWPLSRKSAIADKVVRRRAYDCALQTAIDLALTGLPDDVTLASLLDACRKSQRGLHQAFNFCIARTALRRAGRVIEAEQFFNEYLENRREPWSVPDHLVSGADLLGPNPRGAERMPQPYDAQ